MFQTVFPSIIRSLRLYIQHQVYVKQVSWLLASGSEMELIFSKLENCASSWFYYRNSEAVLLVGSALLTGALETSLVRC